MGQAGHPMELARMKYRAEEALRTSRLDLGHRTSKRLHGALGRDCQRANHQRELSTGLPPIVGPKMSSWRFQSASAMHRNARLRQDVDEMPEHKIGTREEWQ